MGPGEKGRLLLCACILIATNWGVIADKIDLTTSVVSQFATDPKNNFGVGTTLGEIGYEFEVSHRIQVRQSLEKNIKRLTISITGNSSWSFRFKRERNFFQFDCEIVGFQFSFANCGCDFQWCKSRHIGIQSKISDIFDPFRWKVIDFKYSLLRSPYRKVSKESSQPPVSIQKIPTEIIGLLAKL
jgi:hypothetical protein